MEDDDVPDLRIGEVVFEAIDQHSLIDVERRLHRARRDLVRLDDPVLDAERKAEGERDDDDELEERALGALGPGEFQSSSACSGEASFAAPSSGSCSGSASACSPPSPATSSASSPGVSGVASGSPCCCSDSPSGCSSPSCSAGSTTSGSASLTATPSASTASASSGATTTSSSMPHRRSATRALLPTFSRR